MAAEHVAEPIVGTLWWFPRWTNPDFTGAWEVVQVGGGEGHWEAYEDGTTGRTEGLGEFAVFLRRCGGHRQVHETDVRFWPGGWEEWPA